MPQRGQESPFRETEWDQRLDRMLDDLNSSIGGGGGGRRSSPSPSPLRSSSRSESASRRGVEEGGRMKHHHHEYTSPDKSTRIVRDQYEYDTGDGRRGDHYQKKVMKSTYSSYKTSGGLTNDLDNLKMGPSEETMRKAQKMSIQETKVVSASQGVATTLVDALSSIGDDKREEDTEVHVRLNKNIGELDSLLHYLDERTSRHATVTASQQASSTSTAVTSLESKSNGELPRSKKLQKELEDEINSLENNYKSSDVRRIVWRNRYEKAQEATDSSPPKISIEEDSKQWRRREKSIEKAVVPSPPQRSSLVSPRTLRLQYAVYWPAKSPHLTPNLDHWVEPIPLPTPPQQLSPGEPGVAYVYSYGNKSSSEIQHLPPLNYVALPGPTTSVGGHSPTPSQTSPPIVYHYSYHYTIQPGQELPPGAPQPPASSSFPLRSAQSPPVLQIAAHDEPSSSFKSHSNYHQATTITTSSTTKEDLGPAKIVEHYFPEGSRPRSRSRSPGKEAHKFPVAPIPKSSLEDYPPATSTPYPTRGKFPSPRPTRKSYTDSLEKVKRPQHEGLPFPETSPLIQKENANIPKKVDDLMSSFSESEDGPVRVSFDRSHDSIDTRPLIANSYQQTPSVESQEKRIVKKELRQEPKKEPTKNVSGPPVYYPPGHEMFHETMHTMTLKEGNRRGRAKWRKERSEGQKDSSSQSQEGGVKMVPVCLPLCCGAACVIM